MDEAPCPSSVAVELNAVSVSTPERALLERVDVRLAGGKITLLVGGSGVGKSILVRLIAGLLDRSRSDVRTKGSVRFVDGDGQEVPASVGVVFQSLAIFDELSPLDNVRLGADHRRGDAVPEHPRALLEELGVPRRVPSSYLSGGQRQRLAIARALAQDPDVLLYDEPTSGLDVVTARRVARLIAETQRSHPKTCLIVTHDPEPLLAIADHILLLHADQKTLIEIGRADWVRLEELLQASFTAGAEEDTARPPGLIKRAARLVVRAAKGTSRLAEETVLFPFRLMPLWRSSRWGLRYFVHDLRLVAGPSAWVYLLLAGAIVGYVATYFPFVHLPYARYSEPLVVEDLVSAIGFAIWRILVPVFATLLIAARSGAAIAADIGGKVYGRQFDVLRTLGVRPASYMLTGTLWSFLLGTPLLVGLAYLSAALTSLTVFTALRPELGPAFWNVHFHRAIQSDIDWLLGGWDWWLAKVAVCGAGAAEIAYHTAASPKRSASDVASGITRTVLLTTIFVLIVHFIFALIEF